MDAGATDGGATGEGFNRAGRRAFERKKRAWEAQRRRRNRQAVFSSGAVLGIGATFVPATGAAAAVGPVLVDTLGDSPADEANGTTLREAIENANADATPDVITFSVSGTIQLEQGQLEVNSPMTIDGGGQVTVAGNTLAPHRVFYFADADPFAASLYDLVVTGGDAGTGAGGGIGARGVSLTLDGVTVQGNDARSGGGIALFNVGGAGTLTVLRSTVSGNTAGTGGGIYLGADTAGTVDSSYVQYNGAIRREVDQYGYGGYGGGIFVGPGSVLSVQQSSDIYDNFASYEGGGIATRFEIPNTENVAVESHGYAGRLDVSDSSVRDNFAATGGGIHVEGGPGTVRILRADLSYNVAQRGGGGMAIMGTTGESLIDARVDASTVAHNVATGVYDERGGLGGGILSKYAQIVVDHTLVDANRAEFQYNGPRAKGLSKYVGGSGGGLALSGGLSHVVDSTVSGNSAVFGGGVWANGKYGQTVIERSTLSGNTAKYFGGGAYVNYARDASFVLVDSTVSGNATRGLGGGVFIEAKYDDEPQTGPAAILAHSTISDNYAEYDGGGIFLSQGKYNPDDHTYSRYVALDHTIVGINDSYGFYNNGSYQGGHDEIGGYGTIVRRFSLISNLGEVAPTIDLQDHPDGGNIEGDPELEPLGENGGPEVGLLGEPMLTHHPRSGSPVIDAGQSTTPSEVPVDQRGRNRKSGSKVDIGAVEVRRGGGGGAPVDPFECTEDATMPAQDVPDENVHKLNIACLYEIGGTVGTGPRTYSPGDPTTRGQMASFIVNVMRIVGYEFPDNPPDAFDDDNGHRHERSINLLASVGIVSGKAPRVYDPQGEVTREQMAQYLFGAYQAVTGTSPTATGDHFTDDEESDFEEEINIGFELGLFVGQEPGSFNPTGIVRRDQMATFLINLVDKLADEGSPPLLR